MLESYIVLGSYIVSGPTSALAGGGARGWRLECSSGGRGGLCGADRVWSPCDPYACSLGTYDLRAATKKVA